MIPALQSNDLQSQPTLTKAEVDADAAANAAMRAHQDFRQKHAGHFEFVGRNHPITGEPYVTGKSALDHESQRLHAACIAANKNAADVEYAAKHPAAPAARKRARP